jgi:hypothetical protein
MRGLVEDLGPLGRSELGPARESLLRGLRRLVDVGGTSGRHDVDDLACRRVANLVCLAGSGLGPLAFDDHRRHSVRTPLR